MDFKQEAKNLVAQMTLEEKASLCSGKDFWHLKGIERLGLNPIMVTDGPHGLRKQAESSDHLGINESVPATCFPTASATACTFNEALLEEIGTALGEECQQENVAVLLGPGVNIKRSPLCGRNFEYFSEDPYLAGRLGGALVKGVQSQGVGTSVKHYAANNQETRRMSTNSVIDMRALREIYLAAYETMVKETQPWTFMCSYNLVNGTYASDNKWLLSDVLRDEWGYEGLVVTDWGATDDRVQGVRAGLDLEMPSSGGLNDAKIVKAVNDGTLTMAELDKVTTRVTELILKHQSMQKSNYTYNAEDHHALARRAAAESCVLLKNEGGALPLEKGADIAVIGAFAKTPRYQGSGSSKINPTKMDNAFDALTEAGFNCEYAEGYKLKTDKADDALIDAACKAAEGKKYAVIFAGLPDEYESEGFDRSHMNMPESHNKLIEAVAAVNPNTVVVLQLGAPVVMPWLNGVKGVLAAYLGGQAGGSGCADILCGAVCPSGHLAESWPLSLEDNPSHRYFPGGKKSVEYRESLYVGYRYYDTAKKPVAFPFGFGLSYTSFEYSGLEVTEKDGGNFEASFTVKNTGKTEGAAVPQLYVGRGNGKMFRPEKELKGFAKLVLKPGESKTVTLALNSRSFAYYNTAAKDWAIEGGTYKIMVGASAQDILLTEQIELSGDGKENSAPDLTQTAAVYYNLPAGQLEISDSAFTALYGAPLPPSERGKDEPFTLNSTIDDIKHTKVGQQIAAQVKEQAASMLGGAGEDIQAMFDAMILDMPLRSLVMMSGGAMSEQMLDGILNMLNGHPVKGAFQLWRSKK